MCQCTDWLSATQNGQSAAERVSAPCGNWTNVTSLTVTCLNHFAVSLYQFTEKSSTWLITSSNLEPILCVQNCHFRIAQVEYQGQTQYTTIVDSKPLSIHVITLDRDWNGNIFTQVCSMLIEQLIDLRKLRTENLKIRTDMQDWRLDGWSVTQ